MSLMDALLLEAAGFDVWVSTRTDAKGTGTNGDPLSGSDAAKFDALMRGFAENTHIHLGPGTFQTRGYSDGVTDPAVGWQPKRGMKISGAGVDVTTLKLVGAAEAHQHYFAIGHPLAAESQAGAQVDYFEVSDLTIDCNVNGSEHTVTQLACGAIRVKGHHTLIRRIKAIHWGTKTTQRGCFVIAVITGDPRAAQPEITDTGIAECIAITPYPGTLAPVTVFHAGGKEDAGVVAEAFGRAPFIRNCFVDCTDTGLEDPGTALDPFAVEIRGLSMGWCRGGVVEGNQVHNIMYGGPYQDKATTRDLTVRRNFFKNVVKGPFWNLGTANSPAPATLIALSRDLAYDSTGKTAVAQTSSNPSTSHGLLPGDRVKIAGCSPDLFNGVFVVKDIPAANKFRYVMSSAPANDPTVVGTWQKAFGVGKLVVEGNTIELAAGSTGGIAIHVHDNGLTPNTPDYTHDQVVIGNNKIRYFDGMLESNYAGQGIEVNGARNVLVRNNVVECAPANPLKHSRCGATNYFNNKSPAGVVIRAVDSITGGTYGDLESDAEDALVMALFNKR